MEVNVELRMLAHWSAVLVSLFCGNDSVVLFHKFANVEEILFP